MGESLVALNVEGSHKQGETWQLTVSTTHAGIGPYQSRGVVSHYSPEPSLSEYEYLFSACLYAYLR